MTDGIKVLVLSVEALKGGAPLAENRKAWVHIPALLCTSRVVLGTPPGCDPQLSHL